MKFKKWISMLLAGLTVFAMVCTSGCKGGTDSSSSEEIKTETDDGPSYATIKTENYDFIRNGETDYKIVVPADMTENEQIAVNEFNVFLEEATGITLPIVKDNVVKYDNTKEYISIGRTSFFEQSGIEADEDLLKTSGYAMKSIGKTLYLYGGADEYRGYGVIYAVYGFLAEMINLKIYAENCYTYDSEYRIKMKSFDVLEIPDYDDRQVANPRGDGLTGTRLRYLSGNNNIMGRSHTGFLVLPKDQYYDEHQDWYTNDGKQLRLLNMEMRAQYIENVKQMVREKPTFNLVFMGVEDNMTVMSPEDYDLAEKLYGTRKDSGVNIAFCNAVIEAIEEWLPTEFPGRELKYETCAYYSHFEPPVYWDEATQSYKPDSEWVVPHEKLCVQLTTMALPTSAEPFDSEQNMGTLESFKGWAAICDNLSMYNYGTNFRCFFVNFNNFSSYQANVRIGKELGLNSWFEWCGGTAKPTFEELRMYVQMSLLWDTSLNFYDLAKEFINAYYGLAAPQVLQYFDLVISSSAINVIEKGQTGGKAKGGLDSAKYWPFELVNRMATVLDDGEAQYASIKTEDEALYNVYLDRIRQQKASVQYLQMKHYAHYYSTADITRILDEMEQTCVANGFMRVDERDETDAVQNLINGWRKSYIK